MFDIAGNQIGNRFDTAVWVPRKTFNIIFRVARIERIQHQERVEIPDIPFSDHAGQFHSGAVPGMDAGYDPDHFSVTHIASSS